MLRNAVISMARILRAWIRGPASRVRIRGLLKKGKPLFLELGSGDHPGLNGWTTVDTAPRCDVFWDLRDGLPFPDCSVAQIYSSHLFEHFTFSDGQKLLRECQRVLLPGGHFSICVPNARLYIDAYVQGRTLDATRYFRFGAAFNATTSIDAINYIAYMSGHHRYMFDEENLLHVLRLAGFKNVRARAFDAQRDSPERDAMSIYAEADK